MSNLDVLLQLQQERRKLIAELEEVRRERDGQQSQTEQLRRELNSLRAQLEETEWSLCQKSGEEECLKNEYAIYINVWVRLNKSVAYSGCAEMLLPCFKTFIQQNIYTGGVWTDRV